MRDGITSLSAAVSDAAQLATRQRGHWQVANGLHHGKDGTLKQDASQTHVGNAVDVLAMLRNTAISLIRRAGQRDIAASLRRHRGCPHEAPALPGIHIQENA